MRRGENSRHVVAQGQDIYAFSAPLVCEAAQRLIEGQVSMAGAHAPGVIFNARDFLCALVPDHLALETTTGSIP